MTENCELCGRGMAKKTISPAYWPHQQVCQRSRCRAAVVDALEAVEGAREQHSPLVDAMARRHEAQVAPLGWRQDSMADIGLNEEWWATEVVKSV
jgi:hypothetical protein